MDNVIRYWDRGGLKSLRIGFQEMGTTSLKWLTQFETHHYDVVGKTACYYVTETDEIMLFIDGENTKMIRKNLSSVYNIQISPDSTRVLYIHGTPGRFPTISVYHIDGESTSDTALIPSSRQELNLRSEGELNISTDFRMEKFLVLRFDEHTLFVYDLDSGKAMYNKEKTDKLLKSSVPPVFLEKVLENERFEIRGKLKDQVFRMHIKIQIVQNIVKYSMIYGMPILDIIRDIVNEYGVMDAFENYSIKLDKGLTLEKILEYANVCCDKIMDNTKIKSDLFFAREMNLDGPHFVSDDVIEMGVKLQIGNFSEKYTIHVDVNNVVVMDPEMKIDSNWDFRHQPFLYNRKGLRIPRDKSMKHIVAENNIFLGGKRIEGINQKINVDFTNHKFDVAMINGYIYEFNNGVLRKRPLWTTVKRLTQTYLKLSTSETPIGNTMEFFNLGGMFDTFKFGLPKDRVLFTRETLEKHSEEITNDEHHPLEVCIGIDMNESYDDQSQILFYNGTTSIEIIIPDKEFLTIVPMWLDDKDLDIICKRVETYLKRGYIIWNRKPEFDNVLPGGKNRFQRFLTYDWANERKGRMQRKRVREISDNGTSKRQNILKALAELSLRY